MSNEPDLNGPKPPRFVIATELFVAVMSHDLHDPKNQGPNFDPRTFPIGELTAAFLKGGDVIGATADDLEESKRIAIEKWAKAWHLEPSDIAPGAA